MIRQALVVFTSDHGESLHEHGEATHGYFVYQSTVRVPLIIHCPVGSPAFAPRVAEPISLLDIAPTLLQIVGIERPAEFQGHNLVNLIAGHAGLKASASEEIYSESLYPHAHFGTSALRALPIGRQKCVQAPRPEFYDLAQARRKNTTYTNRKIGRPGVPPAALFRCAICNTSIRPTALPVRSPALK